MFDRLLEMDWSMKTVYMLCAAVGGVVLLLQTLLLFFGLGDADVDFDGDVDVDAGDGSFSVLSIRTLFAFFTFFGLAGWGALSAGWGQFPSLAVAVGAGLAIMLVVAWLMSLQMKLQSSGTIDPANAIGKTATVYLRIPANRSGQGKITVSIQGRSVQFLALTGGDEIPTGGGVRILSMPTQGTFEVVSLNEE